VRAATAIVAATLMAACGSTHNPPQVASPFVPPSTTTPDRPSTEEAAGPAEPDPDDSVAGPDGTDVTERSDPYTTEVVESTTTVAPSTTTPPQSWASFDASIASQLIDRGDYAVGVAIAIDGEIVHTAEFGYRVPPPFVPEPPPSSSPASSLPPTTALADPSTTTPVTTAPGPPPELIEPGDRFRIASISKVITAIVVLQLVEAGQLGLDEPVGQRLADLVGATITDPQVPIITVRQLLAHTGGFSSYQSTFFRAQVDSCPAAAQYGLSRGLSSPPGVDYTYSNLNYCLLGLLIQQVAGRPYEAVVTDRLLAPLRIQGMRLATTYDADPAQVVHPSAPFRNYMEVLGAAGSWVATPSDVVTVLASLDRQNPGFHPLSQGVVDLMRTPVLTASRTDPTRGYGLGMMAFGDGAFGHTGTVENTHAMVVDRADGVTWSVLVSGEYPGNTGNLAGIFDQAITDAGVAFLR